MSGWVDFGALKQSMDIEQVLGSYGVALQRVYPDGSVQTLSPAEAEGHLFVTLQDQLPRQTMTSPTSIDPRSCSNNPLPMMIVRSGSTFGRKPPIVASSAGSAPRSAASGMP